MTAVAMNEWRRRVALDAVQALAPGPFIVKIGTKEATRLEFACLAQDSVSAVIEFQAMAERGEKVEAFPVRPGEPFPVKVARHELEEVQLRQAAETPAEYAQRRARENDQRAMALQVQGMATGEVR